MVNIDISGRVRLIGLAVLAFGALAWTVPSRAAAPAPGDALVVTLLGSGTPELDPDRFGNSTLVQAGGLNLVFDAGRGAAIRLNQAGVSLGRIDAVFLSHFHSDHLNGLADLWMTGYLPPVGARQTPLQIYGPTGTAHIVHGLLDTYQADISIREADEHVPPAGTGLEAHEFDHEGVVFDRDGVKVTAFEVDHGALIKPSYGYRIDYAGHAVTLSSDTRYDPNVIKYATGADLLLHEVAIAPKSIQAMPAIQRVLDHHSSPEDAGRVFAAARPKLAVFYHIVRLRQPGVAPADVEEVATRSRGAYDGPIVIGEDLMRFIVGRSVAVIPLSGGR